LETQEGSAFGAALLAMVGTGEFAEGGLLIYRLTTKALKIVKDKDSPYQYLTQVVTAQQRAVRLMLPLGLER